MELSKSQKKLAREIIEKGLQAEFARGLSAADKILSGWKNQSSGNKEAYHALFHHIWEFDKHIAARYDHITGSRYLLIISDQLYDGVISEDDIAGFPPELQEWIKEK